MKEFKKNIKRTWIYTKDQKKELFLYMFMHLIDIVIGIVLPIISAKIIIYLTKNNYYQIALMALIIFFIESTRNLIYYGERKTTQIIYRETFNKIQINLGKEILKLENKVLDEKGTGVFIQRINGDTEKLSEIFNDLGFYLSEILKNIGIFIAIFIINKTCFIYLLISSFIIFLVDKKRVKIRKENKNKVKKKEEISTGFVNEMIRGARDIKMLNGENSFINELDKKIKDTSNEKYYLNKIDRMWTFFTGELRDIGDLGLIILLILLLKENILTGAFALVIYNYSSYISYITMDVSYLLDLVADFNVSATRVYNILDSKEFDKEVFGKKHLDKIKGNFEFKNVSFAYNENNSNKVLDNISFKINSRETIAFVGKSGAGKTTIFNLLCKMYPKYKGKITIDGIDIKELDKDSIRGNITIISQNPYIFNVSIKDNLRLVKEDVTDEEIYEACRLDCLNDLIDSLLDKYDTIIGEGGITLSGGQKQRLAIARALVQKTEIILFDEATSALDNETQEQIQRAIENMRSNFTILIIAHRLSTIINSDRILFLNNGKIEAEGTHKELLKKCPEYKQLYKAEIEK